MNNSNDIPNNNTDLSADLSVVIPAFNEEKGVGITIDALLSNFPKAQIIVVDDGSTDDTFAVASAKAVTVFRHDFNRGYGAALKTGMLQTSRSYIAWFDADNEHRHDDLQSMLEKISLGGKLAAVIGKREHPHPNRVRVIGKWVIKMTARVLGVDMGGDINCGLRIFRRTAILPHASILPDAFSASLTSSMILIAMKYPFEFYPVQLNQRMGVSKVTLADGFSTLTLVLRMIMLFAPLRIFFSAGFLLAMVGGIYGLSTALTRGMGIPPASTVVTLAGVLLILLGLIADQISQIRLTQLSDLNLVRTSTQDQPTSKDP